MDFWLMVAAGTMSGLGTFFILYLLRSIFKSARAQPTDPQESDGLLRSLWLPRDFVTALVAVLFGSFIALVFLGRIDAYVVYVLLAFILPMYIVSRLQGGK